MKNINSISPKLRDEILNRNIGKYNQVKEIMIYPIGTYQNIYDDNIVKKESLTPNGLFDYINNITTFTKKGELEENIDVAYFLNREKISIDLGYESPQLKQYSYQEGQGYHEPKDKNWISMGADAGLGILLGDSVGISSTSNGVNIVSTSLDASTSIPGRLVDLALGTESNLGKIGLTSLGFAMANSVAQKARISEDTLKFFEKPIGFLDAVDTLDFDKMGSITIPQGLSNFSQKMLPLYLYTEVKKSDIKDYSWANDANEDIMVDSNGDSVIYEFPPQSLLYKTQRLFSSGKIQTLVSSLSKTKMDGDSSINDKNPATKGRNLGISNSRSWNNSVKYDKISSLIRPLSSDNKETLKANLARVRPNADSSGSLEKYGVLQDDGFVKIAPYRSDAVYGKFRKTDIKKYMFSIENLAWKDSIDSLIENTSQEGPNGGRIMWFPPYDISFNETTSVNWNSDVFIGRGEPVYTYTNTERNGTLTFKIIVDHPSIINYYKQANDIGGNEVVTDNDYLNFFAGDDVVRLPDEIIAPSVVYPAKANPIPENKPKIITFKVYFPNNYSGINDGYEDAIEYLYHGHSDLIDGTSLGKPNGYEMLVGAWQGLSDEEGSPTYESSYWYRVDSLQTLSDVQKKDSAAFGLNSAQTPDPNAYSFKQLYELLKAPNAKESEFYKTLLDAQEIIIEGSASKHGIETQNTKLAENRAIVIKNWLMSMNSNKNIYKPIKTIISQSELLPDKDVNSKEAKSDRFAYVVITTKAGVVEVEGAANDTTTGTTNTGQTVSSANAPKAARVKKSFYSYYYNSAMNSLRNDEAEFFKKIGSNSNNSIIFEKLSEKIKYFSPAFHSMTPEGFNSRLTFLHQCTRQGPTSEATNSNGEKRSATNMAFGRPPICVLRIGDFYHTKIAIDSMNIDFDPLVWDLNQEGIGVQPMIANVTLNFKFIGGSDLTGPIARLQNAVTFNFFANTGVYDDRNDRLVPIDLNDESKGVKYDTLYNPHVYDSVGTVNKNPYGELSTNEIGSILDMIIDNTNK